MLEDVKSAQGGKKEIYLSLVLNNIKHLARLPYFPPSLHVSGETHGEPGPSLSNLRTLAACSCMYYMYLYYVPTVGYVPF